MRGIDPCRSSRANDDDATGAAADPFPVHSKSCIMLEPTVQSLIKSAFRGRLRRLCQLLMHQDSPQRLIAGLSDAMHGISVV